MIGVPDKPGIASAIFEALARANISVDTIIQNASINRITDLTFTVAKSDLNKAMEVIKPVAESIGARNCTSDAARMFKALAENEINIEMIATSEIRITCIIDGEKVPQAVQALHRAFEIDAG